ncbi:ribonuclease H-like domain-containing protein, partial [Tanacetum coccineum]
MRYVQGTLEPGLQYYAFATTSDVDWAGCPSTRSAEAEYRGVANVVAETAWIRNLLRELHSPLLTATLVYCDNVSAVYMSSNPVQHQLTKHIEIDIHFVRDMVRLLERPLQDINNLFSRSSSSSFRQSSASKIDQLYEISYVPEFP